MAEINGKQDYNNKMQIERISITAIRRRRIRSSIEAKNENQNFQSKQSKIFVSCKSLLLLISVMQLISLVASFHLPYGLMRSANNNNNNPLAAFGDTSNDFAPMQARANRRQDDDSSSDYDELTPKASEAHRNNDDNNGDGYGETENGKC